MNALLWKTASFLLLSPFLPGVEISTGHLVDRFDPALGLQVDAQGRVAAWANQADAGRSVTTGSVSTSVVTQENGRPMIRFAAPANGGALSYRSPGAAALAGGYTIFVVAKISPTSNDFPRFHRGANDSHALFFRTSNGNVEVKANPLAAGSRPMSGFSSGEVTILTALLRPDRQELFFNGLRVSSSSATISSYTLDNATFEIGNSVVGDIGHVLVYGPGADDAEINQTGEALASLYGTDWGGLADPPPPPVPVFAPAHPPLMPIVAHRGNSGQAPENTLAAIRAAKGVAQMTEFDVYVTADGELIVMHDATLDRTTNGSGPIASANYHGGIDQLDAGSWFSPAFAGEPVPTLAQAVTTALDLGLIPVIERKSGSAAAYHAALSSLGVLDRVHVIAFDWNFLAQFRQLSPKTAIGALGSGDLTPARIQQAQAFRANYLDWEQGVINAAKMDLARQARLPVMVWTVNNQPRMNELIALGVSSITTDVPAVLDGLLPSFGDWSAAAAQGLDENRRGFDDDPDGDGLSNGVELVLGSPPATAGKGSVQIEYSPGGAAVFRHPRSNTLAKDVYHRYFWSRDLVTWHANGEASEDGLRVILQPEVETFRGPSGVNDVVVHVAIEGGTVKRLFFRLQAGRL